MNNGLQHSKLITQEDNEPMKDEKGLYYYPFPRNRHVRMYVREDKGTINFRFWNKDDSKLWEEHGWVPYEAIKQAAAMYKSDKFSPNQAYDIEIARTLIKEEKQADEN